MKNKNSFTWSQQMPWCVTENSSFMMKLSQACLGRQLIFRRGILEETPRLMRYGRISEHSLVVQFSILLTQQVNDTNEDRHILDETRVISLCSFFPHQRKFRVSILHSLSIGSVRKIQRTIGWHSHFRLKYGYLISQERRDQVRVHIDGAMYLHHPLTQYGRVIPTATCSLVQKQVLLSVCDGARTVRRLS
jgi:hypothetical protein